MEALLSAEEVNLANPAYRRSYEEFLPSFGGGSAPGLDWIYQPEEHEGVDRILYLVEKELVPVRGDTKFEVISAHKAYESIEAMHVSIRALATIASTFEQKAITESVSTLKRAVNSSTMRAADAIVEQLNSHLAALEEAHAWVTAISKTRGEPDLTVPLLEFIVSIDEMYLTPNIQPVVLTHDRERALLPPGYTLSPLVPIFFTIPEEVE